MLTLGDGHRVRKSRGDIDMEEWPVGPIHWDESPPPLLHHTGAARPARAARNNTARRAARAAATASPFLIIRLGYNISGRGPSQLRLDPSSARLPACR